MKGEGELPTPARTIRHRQTVACRFACAGFAQSALIRDRSRGYLDARSPDAGTTLLIFYALVSTALALFIVAAFLYWRNAKTLGLALPSSLEAFRLTGIGIAVACFSSGIWIVEICVVSMLAPDRLGPWFFGGVPNDLVVAHARPIEAVLVRAVLLALVAPLLEELVFRGWAFRKLNRRWGFVPAAVASSALFAAIHYDRALIGPFVFGLVACKVYQESGNLLSPVLAHSVFNMTSMAVSIAFLEGGLRDIHIITMRYWNLLPAGIVAMVAGGGVSVWALIRRHRRDSPESDPLASC